MDCYYRRRNILGWRNIVMAVVGMSGRGGFKGYCTPKRWVRAATAEALAAGVDPVKVLCGSRRQPFQGVRWAAWRKLAEGGYSFKSIGTASGFDHTTVRYASLPAVRDRLLNISRTRAREVVGFLDCRLQPVSAESIQSQ